MFKVKIKNFQSIADTEFEIEGFTVIVGKNNRGKSAIIRAVDAALSNKVGNNFIRWGKLQTEIDIETKGLDISWIKGETASYKINAKPYTSLNRTVPKPISDAGFKKLEIAEEKINPLIAHQFEELFLINKSGPFVTEAISTLYDLNDINDADSLCQKKLRSSKSLLKTRLADADSLTEKIKKFEGIEEIKSKWDGVKRLIEKQDILKKELEEIDYFSSQIKICEENTRTLKNVLDIKITELSVAGEFLNECNWLESIITVFKHQLQLVQDLKKVPEIILPDIDQAQKHLQEVSEIQALYLTYQKISLLIEHLKNVPDLKIPCTGKTQDLIQEVKTLTQLTEELKTRATSCNECKSTLAEIKSLNDIITKIKAFEIEIESLSYLTNIEDEFRSAAISLKLTKGDLEHAEEEFNSADSELKQFDICPLCNTPLKSNK